MKLVRQLCHRDTCVHMELVAPAGCGYVVFVTVRKETQYRRIDDYRLPVVGGGGSVPRCNWLRRCMVGTAFRLAQFHFLMAEGRLPDGRLPRGHQPQGGS